MGRKEQGIMNEERYACDTCGEMTPESLIEDDNMGINCRSCWESKYRVCDDCGDTEYKTDTKDGLCEDCWANTYFWCNYCDERADRDDRTYTNNGYVCGSCLDYHHGMCCRCEGYYHTDYLSYNDYDDAYCETCWEENRRSGAVYEYDYIPSRWHRHGWTRNENTYGVEAEMECEGCFSTVADGLTQFSNNERLFIMKEDGSLNEGFEVVTHPCTLDFHRKEFPWKRICRSAVGNGARAHMTGTCGIHIHVNKSALNYTQTIKLGMFVYYHEDEIKMIARRGSCSYSVFLKDFHAVEMNEPRPTAGNCNCVECDNELKRRVRRWERTNGKKIRQRKLTSIPDGYEKYDAVNFEHRDTIELRMFKGSLKYTTILASIEFVDAMVEYVKTVGSAHIIGGKAWGTFMSYVRKNNYKYLLSYIRERRNRDNSQ
jgi:hypothetical protein